MKSTFTSMTILGSATLAAVLMVGAAFHVPAPATLPVTAQVSDVASVTVVAKRMSAEQKLAFDLETQTADAANAMQTVVISVKRLTAEQKLAMEQEDKAMQTVASHKLPHKRNNG